MSMVLHLQKVPPRNGLLWIRHGFKVVQRSPLAMIGLYSLVLLMFGLSQLFPPLAGLGLLAMPLVSLGFMLATHLVLQNQVPTLAVFNAPLRLTPERRKAQLLLSGAFALSMLAAMALFGVMAGDTLALVMKLMSEAKPDPQAVAAALEGSSLFGAVVVLLTLIAAISAVFWHAPALVHWGGQGVMQSLFSSTLAMWRNKAAFALNMLAWVGLAIGTSSAVGLVASVLGLPASAASLLLAPIFIVGSTAFYASLYFSFVDCFMFGAPRDVLADKH